ncbi:hypothetical protein PENTCL1PPCAC_26801, partial [Pristionchus entomophagus]
VMDAPEPSKVTQEYDILKASLPPTNLKPPKRFHLGRFEATLKQADAFEGYKLKSNDTEGTWRVRLSTMVYRHQPSNRQMSIHHLRLFAQMNMLLVDTYSIRTIMDVRIFAILDDGCLHRLTYDSSHNTVSGFEKVTTLYPPRRDRSLPPSLHFVSATCAVVCDGGRVLTIYETNTARTTWDSFFEYRIIGPQAPGTKPGCDRPPQGFDYGFTIVDARLTMAKQQIDICLQGVRDHDDRPSENFIRWITVWMPDTNTHHWELRRAKSIVCPGVVEFVGMDRHCDHLIVVSKDKPVFEEEKRVRTTGKDASIAQLRDNDTSERIVYVWYQTEEEVKVYCRLEQEGSHLFVKDDIIFEATEEHLKIMANGEVVMNGELGGMIETENTQWELIKPMEGMRRMEFSLKKKQGSSPRGVMGDNMWREVVKGDGRGKAIDDLEDMEWSMQALDIEFVDNEMPIQYWNATKDGSATTSTEKVEDCDMDEGERYIWYLNETTNQIDHYCDISDNFVLFTTQAFPPLSQTRAICLREADDGYVYNFEIFPPRHIQIIKAWGHVQRGKPDCKYAGVSPLGGYGVVVNTREDAFVYWQTHAPTHGEFIFYKDVTRRPYDPKDNHCPMQVLSMRKNEGDEEVDERIIGYVATEDSLILLSSDTLVIHRMRVPPVEWSKSAAEANLETR